VEPDDENSAERNQIGCFSEFYAGVGLAKKNNLEAWRDGMKSNDQMIIKVV